MKKGFLVICLWSFLLLALTAQAGTVKEYSADMVNLTTNATVQKMHIADKMMRNEVYGPNKEAQAISILRFDQGKMFLLQPQNKTYIEMPAPKDFESINDLAGIVPGAKIDIKREKVGAEKVGDYEAEKFKVTTTVEVMGHKTTMGAYDWVAEEFAPLPVRSEIPDQKIIMELRNIKEENQPIALFEIPDGYKRDNALEDLMKKMQK